MNQRSAWRARWVLARLRRRVSHRPPGSVLRCLGYSVRINDGPNFYTLVKDIFINRIYHFEAQHPAPLILDCGSNIGMSILYFKRVYPRARVIGFEADPAVFPILEENIARNQLTDVRLVRAAIAGQGGVGALCADGKFSSCLAQYGPPAMAEAWSRHEVPCVGLCDYLAEPVDLLKMNIEGAEHDALAGCGNALRMIREMVVEYHHLPGLPRTLHKILALLHAQGFEYLINDFDAETNGAGTPPFRLGPETRYFLLIYARRLD